MYSKTSLTVVLDEKRQVLTFEKIDAIRKERLKTRTFNMGNKIGAYSISNDLENFAHNFCVTFYPDYEKRTFRVNIDHQGVTFWETPIFEKNDLLLLTKP